MRPVSLLRAIVAVLVASLVVSGTAVSQTLTSPPDGITVIGMGQATASPDSTLIQITLSGGEMYYGQPMMPQPGQHRAPPSARLSSPSWTRW